MRKFSLFLISAVLSLLLNIILWVVLWSKFGLGSEPIPLHFNIVYGIDFVGRARLVYQLPAAGLLILIVNSTLSNILNKEEKIFGYFLNFAGLLVQVMIFIAGLVLVFLNV